MSSTKSVCGVKKDGNIFQLNSVISKAISTLKQSYIVRLLLSLSHRNLQLAKCVMDSDTSAICPATNMTKTDSACGPTKNSTNWVDAAGLAQLITAGATQHCSTGGSVRLALVAIMFFLLVPIPFLLKSTPPPPPPPQPPLQASKSMHLT
jgi:hypothetical protein